MTLHQLRLAVGDADFFRVLRQWAQHQSGGTVTTDEFIALAERVSGEDLDALFETWLFTPGRDELTGAAAAASGRSSGAKVSSLSAAQVRVLLASASRGIRLETQSHRELRGMPGVVRSRAAKR